MSNMDIANLYNVLIGAIAKQTKASTSIHRNIGSSVSFGDVLAAVSNKDTVSAQDMFSVALQDYNVNVKSGDCNVPLSTWERKDFPAWKFFQDDIGADCLNTWKSKGTKPTGAESYIQSGLSKIGYGQMAVIIPDELREKMEADPQYAWEIAEKVQKYKDNYDRKDNALAATYGYNSTLHQMSKSYCFKLDENGDVKICWVTGGGLDSKKSSEVNGANVSKRQNNQQTQQIQRRFATTSGRRNSSMQTMPIDALSLLAANTDYLYTASYLGTPYAYNDILKNL